MSARIASGARKTQAGLRPKHPARHRPRGNHQIVIAAIYLQRFNAPLPIPEERDAWPHG